MCKKSVRHEEKTIVHMESGRLCYHSYGVQSNLKHELDSVVHACAAYSYDVHSVSPLYYFCSYIFQQPILQIFFEIFFCVWATI